MLILRGSARLFIGEMIGKRFLGDEYSSNVLRDLFRDYMTCVNSEFLRREGGILPLPAISFCLEGTAMCTSR